ncbi:MAG TPA: zf-HC2 domain-containing protein [Clostridia bacterium]|nr:zf-HC2 domain-containing protein [Clostridia bacterium]
MNCEAVKDYMMKYFDGEQNGPEELQFKQHLKTCTSCSEEFNCMEAIFKTLETKDEIEPPENFEALVMDKVNVIEKVRRENSEKRIVWLYNGATLLSIVLLLVFVADLKQVSVFSAFQRIGEYFNSFSSATAAVAGVVRDLFELLGNALLAVIDVSFSIVRSFYPVFVALILMLFVIQRLLHYVGTHAGRETE